jgi:hypothetical protein
VKLPNDQCSRSGSLAHLGCIPGGARVFHMDELISSPRPKCGDYGMGRAHEQYYTEPSVRSTFHWKY